MATTIELSYFNSFWLKRLKNATQYTELDPPAPVGVNSGGTTNGTPNPATGDGYIDANVYEDWYIEEARIRGGYNNVSTD